MTRRTLVILLVISLGINLGVIGTFAYGYLKFKHTVDRGPEGLGRWFEERFDLTPEQADRVNEIIASDRAAMDDIRVKLDDKMEELATLLEEENPDRDAIESIISDLSSLHYEMETRVVEQMLDIREVLTPEQAKEFNEHIEKHLHPKGPGMRKGWEKERGRGGGPGGDKKGWGPQNR